MRASDDPTLHLHREFVEGCYRCDLSRDEVVNATDELREEHADDARHFWDYWYDAHGNFAVVDGELFAIADILGAEDTWARLVLPSQETAE